MNASTPGRKLPRRIASQWTARSNSNASYNGSSTPPNVDPLCGVYADTGRLLGHRSGKILSHFDQLTGFTKAVDKLHIGMQPAA